MDRSKIMACLEGDILQNAPLLGALQRGAGELVAGGESGALLQFLAYQNRDGYTKSNLKIAEDGLVEVYDKKRLTPGLEGVDIGYAIVNKQVFSLLPEENHNFEAVVYPALVAEKRLYAATTQHRYYSCLLYTSRCV